MRFLLVALAGLTLLLSPLTAADPQPRPQLVRVWVREYWPGFGWVQVLREFPTTSGPASAPPSVTPSQPPSVTPAPGPFPARFPSYPTPCPPGGR